MSETPQQQIKLDNNRIISSGAALLSRDDWIYAALLVGTFGISLAQRFLIRNKSFLYSALRNLPGAIGFTIALFVLRWKILYSLPIAGYTVFTLMSSKGRADNKSLPFTVFVVIFSYLLLTRHLHELLPLPELASHANAVQLIITLRAIGLVFEVCDGRYNKAKPGVLKPRRYLIEDPSLLQMFNYLYHYCGLFTGPYYSFQMFLDSSDSVANGFHSNFLNKGGLLNEYKSRFVQLLWSVPLFVLVNKLFPLDGLRTDDVFEWSLLYRLLYAAMVFVVFRMRVYSAWAISESICVTINLGIYPKKSKPRCVLGPTNLSEFALNWTSSLAEADSTAMQNIDVPEVEASEGFRSGVRAWNKSVQSWLALFVHSRSPPAIRMVLTMFVSALWHGTYAGYFMSFLVVPLCTAAEDVLFRLFPIHPDTGRRHPFFHYPYVAIIRCRGFDMMATGFLLKNWTDTHRFWSSLYYWLPISMIGIFLLASVVEILQKPNRVSEDEGKGKSTKDKEL